MSENAIYNAIKEYAKMDTNKGLGLIAIPTGSGKSFNVVKYVRDCLSYPENNKKYFFITPKKTNLPTEDDFLEGLSSIERNKLKDKFFFYKQYPEIILDNFYDVEHEMPTKFLESEQYKNLKKKVDQYWAAKIDPENKESDDKLIRTLTKEEKAFRKLIESELYKCVKPNNYKTVKINLIKTNSQWQWVGKLYPNVFMDEKQFIVCSVNKFMALNDPIVDFTKHIYDESYMDDSILFVDEFDSTKITIGELSSFSAIDCFNLGNALARLISYFSNEYNLIWLGFSNDKKEQIFDLMTTANLMCESICNNLRRIVVTQEDYKNMSVFTDIKTNEFFLDNNSPAADELSKCCLDLEYFIRYTIYVLAFFFENYPSEDGYSYAVYKCLTNIFRQDEFKEFQGCSHWIIARVQEKKFIKNLDDFKSSLNDIEFYDNSFAYFSYDAKKECLTVSDFYLPAEKRMLELCSKTKVIGLSATAEIESPICNYDLSYLKKELDDKYLCLSDVTRNALVEFNKKIKCGYDDINVVLQEIGISGNEWDIRKQSVFDDFIENAAIGKEIYDCICKATNGRESSTYLCCRYYRIVKLFKAFLKNDEIKSLLCMMNVLPKPNGELKPKIIEQLYNLVSKDTTYSFKDDNYLYVESIKGSGKTFETKKNEIQKHLEDGKKVFVMTCYSTMSTGQNFTYKTPDAEKARLIHVNKTRDCNISSIYKDFDAIYLDKPTHVITNINGALKNKEYMKAFLEMEYLYETGEIDDDAKRTRARAILGDSSCLSVTSIYDSESVKKAYTSIIIQALGRVDRTPVKKENVYIYLDADIPDKISANIGEDGMLSAIAQKFIDYCKER